MAGGNPASRCVFVLFVMCVRVRVFVFVVVCIVSSIYAHSP